MKILIILVFFTTSFAFLPAWVVNHLRYFVEMEKRLTDFEASLPIRCLMTASSLLRVKKLQREVGLPVKSRHGSLWRLVTG